MGFGVKVHSIPVQYRSLVKVGHPNQVGQKEKMRIFALCDCKSDHTSLRQLSRVSVQKCLQIWI